MGNIMASFNTGVSGLQTAQTALNMTAHNLSNTTTTGYVRQQTMVTDHFYNTSKGNYGNLLQVGLGTDVAAIRQVRNQWLDVQYRSQAGKQSFYEAQTSTMGEIEDLFGELNGEQFSKGITELWNTFQDLAKTPDSIVAREQLVSTAVTLVDKAEVLQGQLKTYQVNLNTEIKNQVKRINEISDTIKKYNDKIRRFEAEGQQANDYRDSRNQLMDELGKYIDYDYTEEIDGTISIFTHGQYLVSNDLSFHLGTDRVSEDTDMLKVIWDDNGGGDFYDLSDLNTSVSEETDIGSLKGLMIARGNRIAAYNDIPVRPDIGDYTSASGVVDQAGYTQAMTNFQTQTDTFNSQVAPSVVMTVQAQIDQLIHTITTTVNDILSPLCELNKGAISDIAATSTLTLTINGGTETIGATSKYRILDEANAPLGDDEDKTIGTELFSRKSVDRYTKAQIKYTDTSGASITKDVYVYNEEDFSDPYTLYSIGEIEVNKDVLKNPSLLPLTASSDSGFTDGYTMTTLNEILDAWGTKSIATDPNNLTQYDFNGYYDAMISELAVKGQAWNGIVANQTELTTEIENQRQMEMGVSADEELVNLIKYQHSYNASSRYITVVDEMLEHLITQLG